MRSRNVRLAVTNVARAAANYAAKLGRQLLRRGRRTMKRVAETGKQARADLRQGVSAGRTAYVRTHRGGVRLLRYSRRVHTQFWPRVAREISVRGELRRVAASDRPIVVGPWLSEVGYEVLYWVPFLRWYCDRYRVDPSRMTVVSRGGVAAWYGDVAHRYVELLDLFPPDEFAARNAARHQDRDQKQAAMSAFDEAILARVREREGLADAVVCHPSTMFRLLRQFWLGNESLQYLQDYVKYGAVPASPLDLPELPAAFTAVKFYSGTALPATPENRARLRALVARLAERGPVVTLDTGLPLDEHEDFAFRDVPGVVSIANRLTPQNNLAVQTEVIRRASRFVGTCGGLAWLSPMLGTPTVAVYAADDLLGPHLYAAGAAYRSITAAPFGAISLLALEELGPAGLLESADEL